MSEKKLKSEWNGKKILKEGNFEALIPGLVDFTQQIKKCVTYYQTHYNSKNVAENNNINKILLCGNGATLRGLDEFISAKLGFEVRKI